MLKKYEKLREEFESFKTPIIEAYLKKYRQKIFDQRQISFEKIKQRQVYIENLNETINHRYNLQNQSLQYISFITISFISVAFVTAQLETCQEYHIQLRDPGAQVKYPLWLKYQQNQNKLDDKTIVWDYMDLNIVNEKWVKDVEDQRKRKSFWKEVYQE